MNEVLLTRKFHSLGARLKLSQIERGAIRLDIRRDDLGEFFDLGVNPKSVNDVEAVDVRPRERHLLLMARTNGARGREQKEKFLCGHDERHWFVAAVPNQNGAATVRTAMEALKPAQVRQAQAHRRVRFSRRNHRKNRAFVRQGEWFFIPCPDLAVEPKLVLRDEPIQRGGGKPHRCEFLYRIGGEPVYVCDQFPQPLTPSQFAQLVRREPTKRSLGWRLMRRDARVYVRGRVWHPDHKTVVLRGWHQVEMNTESQAPAMRHVAFLD
jgi:hypothetical protein